MNHNLKPQTIKAIFWSSLERFGQQGIQFLITIILARLLLPEEFGLIAMLTVFIAIAQSFINSGFGQALIQRQNTSHVDECSIFYFNIVLGFILSILICLAAPIIASFFDQPLLVPLTYVLSANLIFDAFGLIQTTLLTKRIDFKTQLKVNLIATIISGIIGISMALNGFGVWSLAAQALSLSFFRTLFLWTLNTWRPSLVFSFTSLKTMFVFGSRLLASGLLDTIFQNLYLAVIGKLFSPSALGFYYNAERFQKFPITNISNIINRVTFPVFSSIQDDKPRLKRGVRQALSMIMLISFPVMAGLAIVAKPLILVMLTEKWLPCVPYLQLLCAVGVLYPLHVINLNVLNAQGRSDLFFKLEILKKILVVIAIVITYRWGILAMIYGQIATSILSYFLNAYYTGKLLDYPASEQLQDVLPSLLTTGTMAIGVYAIQHAPITNPIQLLSIQIFSGTAIYLCICYYFKIPSFMEILKLIKPKPINSK